MVVLDPVHRVGRVGVVAVKRGLMSTIIWIYLATDLCQPVTRCNRLARLTQPRDAKDNPVFGRVPQAP
jgi:hypothetical protein